MWADQYLRVPSPPSNLQIRRGFLHLYPSSTRNKIKMDWIGWGLHRTKKVKSLCRYLGSGYLWCFKSQSSLPNIMESIEQQLQKWKESKVNPVSLIHRSLAVIKEFHFSSIFCGYPQFDTKGWIQIWHRQFQSWIFFPWSMSPPETIIAVLEWFVLNHMCWLRLLNVFLSNLFQNFR